MASVLIPYPSDLFTPLPGESVGEWLEKGDPYYNAARTPLNTFALLIALHCWPMPAWIPPGRCVAWLTRLFAAVSIFGLEMQVATWLSLATIRSLTLLNLAIAAAAVAMAYWKGSRASRVAVAPTPPASTVYIVSACLLFALVLTLNMMRPVLAADPYHLDRMAQIERLGTIGYDLAAEPKVNSFGWAYELVLADIHQIPSVGGVLLRFHGLFGIALYLLALSAARTWLLVKREWLLVALLVVPVVFHQFVLIKNDLFGAVPAVAVLAWLIGRSADAKPREIAWAAWLCGLAVAVKVTSAPLALVLAGTLLVQRTDRAAVIRAGVAGGLAGLLCGGFFFTMIENARVYGSPITAFKESGGMGNRNESVDQAAVSVVRFGISLFDLGRYTRAAWPGRGGWGSTFGLPLIWAFAVLARYRRRPEVRRSLWIAVVYMVVFAAIYTDADIAHRLLLGPGLLLILVASSVSDGEDRLSRLSRAALCAVITLSALQIARSATLYLGS